MHFDKFKFYYNMSAHSRLVQKRFIPIITQKVRMGMKYECISLRNGQHSNTNPIWTLFRQDDTIEYHRQLDKQEAHCDIMFMNRRPLLLTVLMGTEYIMANRMKSRGSKDIRPKLDEMPRLPQVRLDLQVNFESVHYCTIFFVRQIYFYYDFSNFYFV